MTYKDLTYYFEQFHIGAITKLELSCEIELWQRAGARL